MSKRVSGYYNDQYDEGTRHSNPFGIIQELRTRELISRYLKNGFLFILDVGGANGVYSFFLADLGHRVSLLDITAKHIHQVEQINRTRESKLDRVILGDAETYQTTDHYDLILLHGPLYHIIDRARRIALLGRMKNLLKQDGLILGFGIHRYAGYFYGVRSGMILDNDYGATVLEEIQSGVRDKAPGWYFHQPEELRVEFEEAGLHVVALKSVTTQIWMLPEIEALIQDPEQLQKLLEIAAALEDELGIGQDLLCVGK